LTTKNAVSLPAKVLDKLGIPGIDVKGRVLDADGIDALLVEEIE
jgi:hypothetical protein